jgi:hypothetical protein
MNTDSRMTHWEPNTNASLSSEMITSMIPSRLSSASSASASAGAYRERTVQTLFISINRVSAAYLMTMKAKDVDELLCVLNEIRVWHPYTPATLN